MKFDMLKNLIASPDNAQEYVRPVLSVGRKSVMLALFCFAEFMDSFIASALFPAINVMIVDLKLATNEATWIFAAYSATFAAFLLISGRVADIYGSSEHAVFPKKI
jgi:MFS family permease